ncbi:nucleoside phosphorylase domain-containing protein [Tribonema minus]|uniref:Nucleoside phosphorylase domain-containing protein n=1 Tax=Tribonema minus TaxID=303371 RepID=A0A835YY09_9STRA|nr:nucleoside phosphorylase domain-containing protein [Tribonema minus]
MEAEAQPLIDHLKLELDEAAFPASAPCKCYTSERNGYTMHVVTNGKCRRHGVDHVGTVAGGLAAWLSIEKFKPDLVINAGTAGGFNRMGAAIGDVFVSSRTVNHDRRIAIPGWTEWGVGKTDAVPTEQLRGALGYKHGVVTTSNSLDFIEEDAKHMLANEASVKDMEGAAVAWACEQHNNTPFFCIKVVTDIVDGDRPTHEEFLENLGAAARSLQEALPKTLDFVMGKRLSEL